MNYAVIRAWGEDIIDRLKGGKCGMGMITLYGARVLQCSS